MATFGEYGPTVVTPDSPCWIPGTPPMILGTQVAHTYLPTRDMTYYYILNHMKLLKSGHNKLIFPGTLKCNTSGADPCSTLGGIIPHFYRFFGILKFWGDIQVLPIFQVLTILKIWGYIQVLTKMYLNN